MRRLAFLLALLNTACHAHAEAAKPPAPASPFVLFEEAYMGYLPSSILLFADGSGFAFHDFPSRPVLRRFSGGPATEALAVARDIGFAQLPPLLETGPEVSDRGAAIYVVFDGTSTHRVIDVDQHDPGLKRLHRIFGPFARHGDEEGTPATNAELLAAIHAASEGAPDDAVDVLESIANRLDRLRVPNKLRKERVLIDLLHDDDTGPHATWSGTTVLRGNLEQALEEALHQEGISLVRKLPPEVASRLASPEAHEMSEAAAKVGATLLLTGVARCATEASGKAHLTWKLRVSDARRPAIGLEVAFERLARHPLDTCGDIARDYGGGPVWEIVHTVPFVVRRAGRWR